MTFLRREAICDGKLTLAQVNQNIDIFNLIDLPVLEIKDSKKMCQIWNNKLKYWDILDNKYALKYQNDIWGIVQIENQNFKILKLLGNKFKKANFNL